MRRRSLFVRIYLSFIVVLVVPIVVLGLVYRSELVRSYQREVTESSLARVRSNRDAADEMMRNVRATAVELSLSPTLRALAAVGDTISPRNVDHVFAVLDVLKVLSNAQGASEDIHSIYLYNSLASSFLTSSREVEPRVSFHDTTWLAAVPGRSSLPFWLDHRVPIDLDRASVVSAALSDYYNGPVATLVYPLSQYATTLEGAVAVNVTTDQLMWIIGRDDAETGAQTYVYDRSAGTVLGADGALQRAAQLDRLRVSELDGDERESGYYRSNEDGARDIVFFARAAESDWVYLEFNRYSDFYASVRAVTVLVIGVSLLLVFAGIGLSYLGARRLYNPVRRLVDDLRERSGIDVSSESNDMRVLSQAFARLRQQESAVLGAMERSRRKLGEHLLTKLLRGADDGDDLASGGLDFPHSHFLCAVGAIDNHTSFERTYSAEQRHYVKELIIGMAREVLNERPHWDAVQYQNDRLAFVFNVPADTWPGEADDVAAGLHDLQAKASEALGITLTFGMGRAYPDREGIEHSFREGMEALKRRLVAGRESFIRTWEPYAEGPSYEAPSDELHRILNALKLGSEEKTQAALDEYFDRLERGAVGYYGAIQAINILLAATIDYLIQEHQDPAEVFGDGGHPYEQISRLETVEDVRRWFSGTLNTVIARQDASPLANQRYLVRLTDCIDQHYTEDISAEDVATLIGVSYSYMRRLFRDQLRTSFHDYLNRKRIDRAKELLRATNRTLRDIALSVGYNNDQSFNRFFKKYEGVTPGEYRRIS
jgi:AraC-like DNA-binding protein